jgi:hypothetical protein
LPELTKDVLTLDTPLAIPPAVWLAERSALAIESLRASGRLRLQVRGESMLPTLWPGDLVEIAPCSITDVRPGEIVLAIRDDRFLTHRFVARRHAAGFVLRGDSVPRPDPEFPNEALLGRLVARASGGVEQRFTECARAGVSDLQSKRSTTINREAVKEEFSRTRFGAAIVGTSCAPALAAQVRPVLPLRPWTRLIGWLFYHIAPARSLALRIHALRRPEHAIPHAQIRTTDLEAS